MYSFSVSVGYERLLKLETEIANTVLQQTKENDGVYVSANIVRGRRIFFAVDNVNFAEDTATRTVCRRRFPPPCHFKEWFDVDPRRTAKR